MRIVKYGLVICHAALLLTACKTVKHTSHTETHVDDSSHYVDSASQYAFTGLETYHESNDSLYGISARKAQSWFDNEDFLFAYSRGGNKLPRLHTFSDNGVTGSIKVDTTGRVKVECECDSFAILVKNLQKTLIKQKDSTSMMRDRLNYKSRDKIITITVTTTTEKHKPLWFWVLVSIGIIIVIGFIILLIIKVINYFR